MEYSVKSRGRVKQKFNNIEYQYKYDKDKDCLIKLDSVVDLQELVNSYRETALDKILEKFIGDNEFSKYNIISSNEVNDYVYKPDLTELGELNEIFEEIRVKVGKPLTNAEILAILSQNSNEINNIIEEEKVYEESEIEEKNK